MPKKTSYSDISLSFTRNPITGDILKLKDDISVKQSVKTLILTYLGEKPFQDLSGTKLSRLIFELDTPETQRHITSEIINVLSKHEPRVQVVNVLYKSEDNYINITVNFVIDNSLYIDEVELSLKRIR